MKNIILCFKHQALFLENYISNSNGTLGTTFCGLGDIIKGFIYTYSYCKKNNYNFYLNLDGHCLKPFLNLKKFKYNNKIPDNVPFVHGVNLENYISRKSEKDVFLMTDGGGFRNSFYNLDLEKDFENIFFSKKVIQNRVKKLFPDCSNVFHARFGDGEMVCKDFLDDYYLRNNRHQYSPFDWYKSKNMQDVYKFIYKNFREEIASSDFVCSDHLSFKTFLSELVNVKFINSESAHLGLKNNTKKVIEDTLVDFYILYNSKKGVSISQYPFGKRPSGFVFWISEIFSKDYKHYCINLSENRISPLVF